MRLKISVHPLPVPTFPLVRLPAFFTDFFLAAFFAAFFFAIGELTPFLNLR